VAVTAFFYGKALQHLMNGAIDLDTDTIKVMLTTSTYTPDQDAHDFRDDVTNEVTGTGYTAGGASLANKALSYDTATNEARWDADDVAWPASDITARRAVYYKARGGAATADELICWTDFGGNEQTSSGTFTIQHAATGIAKITAA
jgi:hypothetical protein